MVTGALGISWSAPESWVQVPDVTDQRFGLWRDALLVRAAEGAERAALAADLERLMVHMERHSASDRTWLVILPPLELRSVRIVALGWWELLGDVGLEEIEAAVHDAPTGPGHPLRSQQWKRSRVGGRDSFVIEQFVEQDRPGFTRPVIQRCICLTRVHEDGLLSFTLDTADLLAFEDVASTCRAVLASVRLASRVEVS